MTFTERQKMLKDCFDPSKSVVLPEGSKTEIHFPGFLSEAKNKEEDCYLSRLRNSLRGVDEDENIIQNKQFVYPVFKPAGKTKTDKAIILLHGLNERKWDKYLAWAHYLSEKTSRAVILFPISFHLNRSMPLWLDIREMNRRLVLRTGGKDNSQNLSTCINLALSERLNEVPERFFLAGLQTANDLVSLLDDIQNGRHPLFDKGTSTDLFAYSIGGLLAQVLYIANPRNLLDNSKMFLFCSGSLFAQMNGISKVILDRQAHERIQEYYSHELEENIRNVGLFSDFFNNNRIGMAFRSMIRPDKFRKMREQVFRNSEKNIYAISLLKDKVIPPGAISETLMGTEKRLPGNMEVMDFSFPYSHEMPFPVKLTEFRDKIDQAFENVFSRASGFFC